MDNDSRQAKARNLVWIVAILLAAAFLRVHSLSDAPPGFTHDEAAHALTARRIVDDNLHSIYFTIGYGREPLYDYAVAFSSYFWGSTALALRLVSAYFSLLTVAVFFAWTKRAFGLPVALLSAAGLAVGFWPVMTGRQALRSTVLPALFSLAILLYWVGMGRVLNLSSGRRSLSTIFPFLGAGIVLGVSFYTYMPARGLWIVLPLLLLYWLLFSRLMLRRMWRGTALALAAMAIVAAPLLLFLQRNPAAEVRIRQLAEPLNEALTGNLTLLSNNIGGGLSILGIAGDSAWRYNIAGKPLLGPPMALLFAVGLCVAIVLSFRKASPGDGLQTPSAAFVSLVWLAAGLAPVLITGPELSTTQAIGMQPVIYLLPALALVALGRLAIGGRPLLSRSWTSGVVVTLLAAIALLTYRDYFVTWANHPQVRVQYETAMVTALKYLKGTGKESAVISTVTPGRFHSPALAAMIFDDEEIDLQWFDGRSSLLLPAAAESTLIVSAFASPDASLLNYIGAVGEGVSLPMRESDQDQPLIAYDLARQSWLESWPPADPDIETRFGEAATLIGYELQTPVVHQGDEVTLVTRWQTIQAVDELVIFVHLLGPDGAPLAQADLLGVPSSGWREGDQFLQLHRFEIPTGTAPGTYPLHIGVYGRQDLKRLRIGSGDRAADNIKLTTVSVES